VRRAEERRAELLVPTTSVSSNRLNWLTFIPPSKKLSPDSLWTFNSCR
jgi:hypothetical protein